MNAVDVISLYSDLQKLSINIWVDGGWGVDALLGEQTRPHKDLDIAIQQQDIPRLRAFLEARGYKETKIEDARPWNFVLGDENGREIDVHVIVLDKEGNGIYGPVENGQLYPSASLSGKGVIQGEIVRCISAEWAVKFHSGYELKAKDFVDVSALCKKFGLDLPEEYAQFRKSTYENPARPHTIPQIE
jgi:lincosamide nucleotidyltransferase A/C/D/E